MLLTDRPLLYQLQDRDDLFLVDFDAIGSGVEEKVVRSLVSDRAVYYAETTNHHESIETERFSRAFTFLRSQNKMPDAQLEFSGTTLFKLLPE